MLRLSLGGVLSGITCLILFSLLPEVIESGSASNLTLLAGFHGGAAMFYHESGLFFTIGGLLLLVLGMVVKLLDMVLAVSCTQSSCL
jgi:hypothetical protein